jgi:hypothetical protein
MSDEIEVQAEEAEVAAPTESEERARAQGWRPKEEYRGPEDKWVDADAFLDRADKELPIARERTRAMERELRELKATVKQFSEHHAKVQEIAYERAVADLKKQRREAIAIGDAEAVEKAEDKLEELKGVKPASVKQEAREIAPEVQTWLQANPWFHADKRLASYADGVCAELQAEDPTRDLGDILREVTKEVKERFPEKFANARRSAPPSVEGAGPIAAGSKGAKTYAALPADARAACDRFVKAGLMTKEQYTKEYFGS